MDFTLILLCAVAALACVTSGMADESQTRLSPDEAQAWTRYLIPLPKQINLRAKVVVKPTRVTIAAPAQRDLLIQQAVQELREIMGLAKGQQAAAGEGFRLTLQVGGAEAAPLQPVKNRDQAYTLFPEPDDRGLRVVALTSRGLYYAAKMLSQLICARATGEKVEMPLLRVTDFPDMAERGLWGSDSFAHLRWLADCKMNVVEQIAAVWVDEQGKGHGKLKPGREPMIEEGPRYGIQPLPTVLHLNQLGGKGVFEAYPELRAQGGDEGAVCFSQPAIGRVLTDWVVELGSLPHVTDVSVWLTENLHGKGGCRCAQCQKLDRNLREARVVLEMSSLAVDRYEPTRPDQ